jgi:hypothetical protein
MSLRTRGFCAYCGRTFTPAEGEVPALLCPDCVDDLLSRPIEHTIELLSSGELAAIVGCFRTWAWEIIRGEREPSWEETRRLRNWLASCARDGNVTHRPRVSRPCEVEVCGARG